ncbi:MAG: hypothetical protein QXW02_02735 [Nitrososphaerota archaeon]
MMFPLLLASSLISWITAAKLAKAKDHSNMIREKMYAKPGQVLGALPLMIIPFLIVANQLSITAWLPSILSDQGASLMEAGLAVGLFWVLSVMGRLF